MVDAIINKPTELYPEDQPVGSIGGISRLGRLIDQLKARQYQLSTYKREIERHLNGDTCIRVMKLDEILTYLLRISNYPMAKTPDHNCVAGAILNIVGKVLHIFKNNDYIRVPYFLTMCATILDIVYLNYEPFEHMDHQVKDLVEEVKRVAECTSNMSWITYKNPDEKGRLFGYVRHVYMVVNARSQQKARQKMKAEKEKVLKDWDAKHPHGVTVASPEIFYPKGKAQAIMRPPVASPSSSLPMPMPSVTCSQPKPAALPSTSRMSSPVSMPMPSVTCSPPKRPKMVEKPTPTTTTTTEEIIMYKRKTFWGLFHGCVMKGKMSFDVLLSHNVPMPPGFNERELRKRVEKRLGKIEEDKHSERFFNLDEYHAAYVVVENDTHLQRMINDLKSIEVIGVDTESNVMAKESNVQLAQIAVGKTVYLFRRQNQCKLSNTLCIEAGYVIGFKTVVFFAQQNDQKHLQTFFPGIQLGTTVDLQKLVVELGLEIPDKNGEKKSMISLSDCTETWLRKPLSKAYTMSNWANEGPLSPEQCTYAANDAFVLPLLLDTIEQDPTYKDVFANALKKAETTSGSPDDMVVG